MVDSDRDAGGVFERELGGNLLHEFHVPHAQIACNGATRGPGGDVFATHGWYAPSYPDLIRWDANGTVLEEKAIWPVEIIPVRILWAGVVPEPASTALMIAGVAVLNMMRPVLRHRQLQF
jgi:hypothetical protein